MRCCVLYNSNNGLLGDALGDHNVQPGLQLREDCGLKSCLSPIDLNLKIVEHDQ